MGRRHGASWAIDGDDYAVPVPLHPVFCEVVRVEGWVRCGIRDSGQCGDRARAICDGDATRPVGVCEGSSHGRTRDRGSCRVLDRHGRLRNEVPVPLECVQTNAVPFFITNGEYVRLPKTEVMVSGLETKPETR
jgi:hypothetical protein